MTMKKTEISGAFVKVLTADDVDTCLSIMSVCSSDVIHDVELLRCQHHHHHHHQQQQQLRCSWCLEWTGRWTCRSHPLCTVSYSVLLIVVDIRCVRAVIMPCDRMISSLILRSHCRSDQLDQARSRDRGVVGRNGRSTLVGFLHDYFEHVWNSRLWSGIGRVVIE